jgi:hypothetical protein
MRINGYSHQEIRRCRVARMLKEAYAQKGVLTQADVAELIGVSAGKLERTSNHIRQNRELSCLIAGLFMILDHH